MFKKIFAVVAACATVATMAVSAFAADYTPADGAITVTPSTTPTDASMYTVMLFKTEVDVASADAVKAAAPEVADIYYINQGTVLTDLVSGMLVKASSETEFLPEGNYIARIGNDKGSVENLIVTVEKEQASTAIILTYGDVNNDGVVNIADGILALRKDAGLLETFTATADQSVLPDQVGDVNGDGTFNVADAILILRKDAGLIDSFTNAAGDVLTTFEYTPAN